MTGQTTRLGWKRTLLAGSCFALAFGAFGCTGQVSGPTAGEPSGTGAGSPGLGGGGTPGQPGSVTLDSGRSVIRRLNQTEYNNTVHDLLGTSLTLPTTLTADGNVDGFDTVGQVLTADPVFFEAVEGSASALADELFALPATDARRTKVFVCAMTTGAEATCAKQILTTFARRAYRRPPKTAEIDSLMGLVDTVRAGGTYTDGLKAAITEILLSPHFLYRVETSVGVGANLPAKPLNAFELATRLSYFFWSTMPDDALAGSADSSKLTSDPAELPAQIQRMLADPKVTALTTNFATEWLTLHRLDAPDINTTVYGTEYDDQLPGAAKQETTMFFAKLVSDNLPLSTLINADFTYANARLAKLYGLTATGTSMSRVSLAGTPRAGVLTQASFLMGNSHPDRSGPVQRGDWILSRILCDPTPPPPDGVVIPTLPPASAGISGRKFLEAHRADPTCASCHNVIDPLGLGFENFDAVGAYRTMDSGAPVNSSGTYPGGPAFTSATELAQLIAKDPRYPACVTRQLLTYAVGRTFSASDGVTYAEGLSAQAMANGGGQWRSFLAMIASSEAFRTNRPDAQ